MPEWSRGWEERKEEVKEKETTRKTREIGREQELGLVEETTREEGGEGSRRTRDRGRTQKYQKQAPQGDQGTRAPEALQR